MYQTNNIQNLSIYKLIGTGYEHVWWTNCHCRYRLLKGARNSKKSYDFLGFEIINKIITDKRRNVVIVRNTFSSHRDSTWARLIKIINQPDFENPDITLRPYFKFNKSEMTITYIPTGQMILFKGFDDPYKLASIEVQVGYLTDVYIEEAFEIKYYDDFTKFDQSIRGKLPDGLFHQITFCFNAWQKNHWLYEKFFKGRLEDDYMALETGTYMEYINEDEILEFGKGVALHISTFRINEFRDKDTYDLNMELLKNASIEKYKVVALGMWGVIGDMTYDEFREEKNVVTPQELMKKKYTNRICIGIDVGLSDGQGKIVYDKDRRMKSATTMVLSALSYGNQEVCVFDEYYYANNTEDKKSSVAIQDELIKTIISWIKKYPNLFPYQMGSTVLIYVDNADIGFRDNLLHLAKVKYGITNWIIQGSTKDKIQTRVDFTNLLMAFSEFLISDKCKNLIREIKSSRTGEDGRPREDFDDHTINACEYSFAPYIRQLKRWQSYKEH